MDYRLDDDFIGHHKLGRRRCVPKWAMRPREGKQVPRDAPTKGETTPGPY